MRRATQIQKEAVLAYVRKQHELQRADEAVRAAKDARTVVEQQMCEAWREVRNVHAPPGVYLFEGVDAVIVSAEVDYPELTQAIL